MPLREELRFGDTSYVMEVLGIRCRPLTEHDIEEIVGRKLEVEGREGVAISLIDPRFVVGRRHLLAGVYMALKSYVKGRTFARRLDVEIMLYMACTKEINKAYGIVGLKKGIDSLLMVLIREGGKGGSILDVARDILGDRIVKVDDEVMDFSEEKAKIVVKAFNITPDEMKMSKMEGEEGFLHAILSRMALLNIFKR